MKNIKISLVSVPVLAIAVFGFFSLFGSAPFPQQALSEYNKNLENAVLYQKTEIHAGKDAEAYIQKLTGGKATPSNAVSSLLKTFTMESWISDHKFLDKSHGAYSLFVKNGDKTDMYVSKNKSHLVTEMTQGIEKWNGSEEEMVFEDDVVSVVVYGEAGLGENEEIMETLFNIDTNNIFQNLEKFQDNKTLTKLPEIKENGRTLVGYSLALSIMPRGAGVVITGPEEIPDISEIKMLNENEKQFMQIYFDKETKGVVKQIDIAEIDGTKYELNVMKVVAEHWIPKSEVGDLFDPKKYGLEKISGKSSLIQVK